MRRLASEFSLVKNSSIVCKRGPQKPCTFNDDRLQRIHWSDEVAGVDRKMRRTFSYFFPCKPGL